MQKTDIWLDVRCGLPFASDSVDSIYSTHMIEHLYPDELEKLLLECARVLKAGGGMRIIVPSLSNAILAFQQNRHDWFYDDFPRHFDSLGGRFSNFVFCDGQHRTAFDLSYLDEVLRKAGFQEVVESAEGQSRLYGESVPAFEPGDAAGLPHSVYVEAFVELVVVRDYSRRLVIPKPGSPARNLLCRRHQNSRFLARESALRNDKVFEILLEFRSLTAIPSPRRPATFWRSLSTKYRSAVATRG